MTYEEILDVEIQKMTLVEKFKMLLNNKKENNALKNRILETLEVENLEFFAAVLEIPEKAIKIAEKNQTRTNALRMAIYMKIALIGRRN